MRVCGELAAVSMKHRQFPSIPGRMETCRQKELLQNTRDNIITKKLCPIEAESQESVKSRARPAVLIGCCVSWV
ncbi:unnamed protein product [Arctogadus glacialis]